MKQNSRQLRDTAFARRLSHASRGVAVRLEAMIIAHFQLGSFRDLVLQTVLDPYQRCHPMKRSRETIDAFAEMTRFCRTFFFLIP